MKTVLGITAFVLLGMASLTVSSCGKYDEGPGFTLLTKKARLTGEWDVKESVDGNDGSVTVDNTSDYVTFEKDGTYKYTQGSTSLSGEWEFSSDKERIKTSFTTGSTTYSAEQIIVRLTNKELWLKDPDTGDIYKAEKR